MPPVAENWSLPRSQNFVHPTTRKYLPAVASPNQVFIRPHQRFIPPALDKNCHIITP